MRERDELVRGELLMQPRYLGRESVIEIALDHAQAVDYDMRIDDGVGTYRSDRVLQCVPRFVASVVIAVRAKIGQRPATTEGNKELVEREALRLMREYRVKEVDIVGHLPLIVRAYFHEDIHYLLPTHEARMSRFERWAFRDTRPSGVFTPVA